MLSVVACPHCSQPHSVLPLHVGQTVRCVSCYNEFCVYESPFEEMVQYAQHSSSKYRHKKNSIIAELMIAIGTVVMVLSSTTKRPRNGCEICGHSWYPKGRNKSLKCPSCNGVRVVLYPGAYGTGINTTIFVIFLVAAAILVFQKRLI